MDWTWDLTELYQNFDDPAIEKDFAALKEAAEQGEKTLASGAAPLETLERMTDIFEEISRLEGKLGNFSSLTLSVEAANERAQQLMDRLMNFSVRLSLLSSAYTRYLGGLSDLERLIQQSEKL